ncbi:hypothetical protein PV326_005821, partial [Microctonus aethiopoides]
MRKSEGLQPRSKFHHMKDRPSSKFLVKRAPYAKIMIGQLVCKSEGNALSLFSVFNTDGLHYRDSTVLFLLHNVNESITREFHNIDKYT